MCNAMDTRTERLLHRSIERLGREVTVHLRDGRRGVTEDGLDVPKRHAAHGEPAPRCVPKRVEVDAIVTLSFLGHGLETSGDSVRPNGIAVSPLFSATA